MKFNILNYSQRVAISMGLDLKDLHILGWIQDFYPKMKKTIIESEEYVWLNYQSLIADMPILEIGAKDSLYRRLKNLVDIGILKHRCVKDKNGSFSHYKITEKIMELLEDRYLDMGPTQKSDGGADEKSDRPTQKSEGVRLKSRIKDNSTNNHSTISFLPNPKTASKPEIENYKKEKGFLADVDDFFAHWEPRGWNGITSRYAAFDSFERKHKKLYPEKYELKLVNRDLMLPEEDTAEIRELRSQIKFELGQINQPAASQYFAMAKIEKISNGFKVAVTNNRALDYEEILSQKLNVQLVCLTSIAHFQ